MIKYLYCFLMLIFVVSCTTNTGVNDGITTIKFDMSNEVDKLDTTSLFSDYHIVALETTDESLISEIDKVIVHGDRIFVGSFERETQQVVFIFDSNGHFIDKIDRIGRGPDEYLQLMDFYIDSTANTLNLISRMDKKRLIFNLSNYEFIETKALPKTFFEYFRYNEGFVGSSGNYAEDPDSPYNIWIMDSDGQIIDEHFKIAINWNSRGTEVFSYYDNRLQYLPSLEFCIYEFNNTEFIPKFKFDFGENHLSKDDLTWDEMMTLSHDIITSIKQYQETEHYVICTVICNGHRYFCLYNKETKETSLYINGAPYTDKYFLSFGDIVMMTDDYICTQVPAESVVTMQIGKNEYNDFEAKYPEQIARLRQDVPALEIYDNPVLVFYKFK